MVDASSLYKSAISLHARFIFAKEKSSLGGGGAISEIRSPEECGEPSQKDYGNMIRLAAVQGDWKVSLELIQSMLSTVLLVSLFCPLEPAGEVCKLDFR